ncbi:MAG: serine/threonine protein kinase [Holophagales bacterium]|nr:serine/threonine protein kinase [Holophagales bacterium]
MPLDEVGPGRTFGSYEVLEELGRGGMGRVYRARHVTLEREVALKLLSEQVAEDAFYVQRFLKEARAAARLNHPGIVQIYDFGQVGSHWFLAMELVEGRSLAHFLKTWGRFSEQNAIVLARQTLNALAVAHAAGIVHRDIKPDNVILGKKGIVKLVDLGLAKKIDDPGASSTGFAAGTPYYISPEQIEGRADVDGRADLYSLGATLFQLVTGQVPFPGPSSAVIMSRHLNERAPDPRIHTPELSEAFCVAVLHLLTRERDRRPRNAEEAEREFALLQAGEVTPPAVSVSAAHPPATAQDPAGSAFETAVSSALAIPAAWDAEVYRRVEEKLAARVGPLARLLVRKATREAADFGDLCRRLAEQIPDASARPGFLKDVLAGPASTRPSGPGSGAASTREAGETRGATGATGASGAGGAGGPQVPSSPAPRPASSPSGSGSSSGPGSFPPALLAAAEQRLAAEIGPLARVLVKQESKRQPNWGALVEALSLQVPDEAGRRRLREALAPLGV